jgi:hypothetical protein
MFKSEKKGGFNVLWVVQVVMGKCVTESCKHSQQAIGIGDLHI